MSKRESQAFKAMMVKAPKVKIRLQEILGRENGYILGLVMVFFVVFTLTGLAFVSMSGFEGTAAIKYYHKTRAFYHAEAGLHKSLWLANHVSKAAATFSDATVSATFDSVALQVQAIGTSATVQDSVKITLTETADGLSGGTNLLLVVQNPGNLTTQESNIKSLVEGWGYTVTTIDQSDSQSNYDTQLAINDVVYVPEEVNSTDLNTKVRNATIGVVCEEVNLVDDLGIATSFGSPSSTTNVNITDNSHYITNEFSTGLLAIFNSSQEVTNISDDEDEQAPGLQILGEFASSQPSIIALEADSSLYDQVLMVVNSTDLSTGASLRKTQLESWGYAVLAMDDSDDQSTWDTNASKSIVTYILEEISSGEMNKPTDFTIGVVYEEDNGDDDIGFAENNGGDFSHNRIDITDNSHYISSIFSTGSLTILTSNDDMAYLSGDLASGRQTLAERLSSSSEVLSVLEIGAVLEGGGSAAGRRVRMPWNAINFNRLNSNGLTLLQRSLRWASEPTRKVKGRRVELPWGGNSYDVNSLTGNGQTLMRRAIEWAAGASTPTVLTYTVKTWEEL